MAEPFETLTTRMHPALLDALRDRASITGSTVAETVRLACRKLVGWDRDPAIIDAHRDDQPHLWHRAAHGDRAALAHLAAFVCGTMRDDPANRMELYGFATALARLAAQHGNPDDIGMLGILQTERSRIAAEAGQGDFADALGALGLSNVSRAADLGNPEADALLPAVALSVTPGAAREAAAMQETSR